MAWLELQRSLWNLEEERKEYDQENNSFFIFFAIIYNQGYILLVPNGYSTRQVCSVI